MPKLLRNLPHSEAQESLSRLSWDGEKRSAVAKNVPAKEIAES